MHEAAKLHIPLQERCLDLELQEQVLNTEMASDAANNTNASPNPREQQAAQTPSGTLHQLQAFMSKWCASFQEMLLEATAAGQLEEADQVNLLDVVDGRLWHFMACCLLASAPVGLPASALQTAQQLMQAVCQQAGIATDSITLDTSMHCPVSSSSQSQQEEAESPATSSCSSLVRRHNVHGNAFVDAFLGPQAVQEGCDNMVADDEQVALFDEGYHWHTGRPLEPTYLGERYGLASPLATCCSQLYMFVLGMDF